MYDNIIKIYNLEFIKNKIESITTVKLNDQLTLHLRLKKQIMTYPVCQTTPMYFHGYRLKQIIHSVSIEHKVLIAYQSRRYKCKLCCKVFSESNPFNQSYERMSLNTKLSILNHLKDIHHNFADTAKLFNVSSQSVINIFDKHIDAHPRKLGEVISIDEVFTNKMNKYKYACVILNFNTSKIIDIIATRHKNYLTEYFSRIPREERLGVKAVVIDMWPTYYDVTKLCFPNAFIKEAYRVFNLTASFNDCDERLDELITEFRNSEFEIYRTFGQTLNTWRDSIKNSFIRIDGRRISNGPIESINNKIKTIIKNSNGIRCFYRFRNKVLYSINKDVPITNK